MSSTDPSRDFAMDLGDVLQRLARIEEGNNGRSANVARMEATMAVMDAKLDSVITEVRDFRVRAQWSARLASMAWAAVTAIAGGVGAGIGWASSHLQVK